MSPRAAVLWTPEFLTHRFDPDHPLNPVRLDLIMRLARELGVLEGVELLEPEPAPDVELERVHVPSYLEAVRAAPKKGDDPVHELGTDDNPIFEGMHEASCLICGGSLLAAREIAEGRAQRAVNIAGGRHHAMPDHASGFCVYSDCAVAISWLLDHGFDRIAYVDVDVDHGDGVQAAFYDDPRVLTISLHQHPFTLWPGTGWPGEYGEGAATGCAVNLALPPATADAGWLRAFHAVVPSLLTAFRPQLLVTQCGADTHAEDPLADLRLSFDGHRTIHRELRELAERTAGRWLALGGGGYFDRCIAERAYGYRAGGEVPPHAPQWSGDALGLALADLIVTQCGLHTVRDRGQGERPCALSRGRIHQTSRGYPRAVNNLAVQALVAAFAANKAIVDESSTRAAVAEVTAE